MIHHCTSLLSRRMRTWLSCLSMLSTWRHWTVSFSVALTTWPLNYRTPTQTTRDLTLNWRDWGWPLRNSEKETTHSTGKTNNFRVWGTSNRGNLCLVGISYKRCFRYILREDLTYRYRVYYETSYGNLLQRYHMRWSYKAIFHSNVTGGLIEISYRAIL